MSDTCEIPPQVVREVSGQSAAPEESASPIIPRKTDLDKVSVRARPPGLYPLDMIYIQSRGEEKLGGKR